MNPRTIKSKKSPRTILAAIGIGVLLMGFILYAILSSGAGIRDARMSGVLVAKEFTPQAERQITIGAAGGLKAKDKAGEYLLTVEVPRAGGKKFTVWVNKRLYDSLTVGDAFDVGPYLTPEKPDEKN